MLFIITILILFVFALYYKQSKAVFTLLLACGILIMGLNYDNPDYINYEIAFNNASSFTEFNIFNILDIGTKAILLIGKELGLNNYSDFRLAYSIVLFIIFSIVICKNCKYKALYFALYLISYIVLDEIQFRNFSSFVVLLPFLIYYINNQTLRGLIFFILGDLLVFTLHFSAIFYLILCLTYFKSSALRIGLTIVFVIAFGLVDFAEFDLAMIEHVKYYDAPTTIGAIASCLLLVGNYLYISWIKMHYLSKSNIAINPKFPHNFELVQQLNFVLLLLCPAVFMNAIILRIWRFISLVNLIYILNLASTYRGNNAETKLQFSALIYSCLIGLWFNGQRGVYESLFNNPLFDL